MAAVIDLSRERIARFGLQAAPRPPEVIGSLLDRAALEPVTKSVFSTYERVITRSGPLAVGRLHRGMEVLTQSGYARLLRVELHPQPMPEIGLRHLSGREDDGFRGDPRKLLLVQGARVELLTGHAAALLQVTDVIGVLPLRRFTGRQTDCYALRFARPEVIITEQGNFFSEDHGSLPPLLSPDEAVVLLRQGIAGRQSCSLT